MEITKFLLTNQSLYINIAMWLIALLSGFLLTRFWKRKERNKQHTEALILSGFAIISGIFGFVFAGIPDDSPIVIIMVFSSGIFSFVFALAGAFVNIGYFIGSAIVTGQWLPLLIIIILLSIGILAGYLYERKQTLTFIT